MLGAARFFHYPIAEFHALAAHLTLSNPSVRSLVMRPIIRSAEITASSPLKFMGSRDMFRILYEKHIKALAKNGYFDVVGHGSATRMSLEHGSLISANRLVEYLAASGYRGGPIRLMSCSTGARKIGDVHGFAQALANKLRVRVLAPSGKLNITQGLSGRARMWISNDGKWVEFAPK